MGRTRLVGVSIGDVRIAIEAPPSLPWRFAREPMAAFAVPAAEPDLHLGVQVGRPDRSRRPRLGLARDAERLEVRPAAGGWQVLLRRGGQVEREVRLDAALREGVVIVDGQSPAARRCAYPLAAPLDRWIVRHRLARVGGLLLPACAVLRDGRAVLFAGGPGSGKTALARALAGRPGVRVLAERLVALRPAGTGFRVHGTPWSEPGAVAPAPLAALHLIRRGPLATALPLDEGEAVTALLGIVPDLDEPAACDGSLAAVERLAARVPVLRSTWARPQDLADLAWGV